LQKHPKGYLDKSEFYHMYIVDLFTDKKICDAVFDLYDANHDGKIDHREWMYATSTLVAGSEKLGGGYRFSFES
jgi:Ca2+-binding EF-hand superfamily protein